MVEVSVVIPTCGRLHLLSRCLGAVVRQRLAPELYEVLLVDDSREGLDMEALLLQSYPWPERTPTVMLLRTSGRQGPAAARNLGASKARGELLAFTDDDTIPDATWLCEG